MTPDDFQKMTAAEARALTAYLRSRADTIERDRKCDTDEIERLQELNRTRCGEFARLHRLADELDRHFYTEQKPAPPAPPAPAVPF
jgi:hypothetical protein